MELQIGQTVTAFYKTGAYIGEIISSSATHHVVKVLAVTKHPVQGDLHNPKQTEGVFFHERRALAQFEKANIIKSSVKPFEGEVLDYKTSLKHALDTMKAQLQSENTPFAELSLRNLATLEADYFRQR